MSETTYGCGEFLPGRGPFNFPDFIEGGNVNEPDPPDPDPPGTKTESDPTDPPIVVDDGEDPFVPPPDRPPGAVGPAPGTIGGGGGGPFAGGTNDTMCRCTIVGTPQTFRSVRNDGTIVWNAVYSQTCETLPRGSSNPNIATLEGIVSQFQAQDPGGTATYPYGKGFQNCNTAPPQDPPRCNGACNAIEVRYTVPPGPTLPFGDPSPANPDDPLGPQEPFDPQPTGGNTDVTALGDLPLGPGVGTPGGNEGGNGVNPVTGVTEGPGVTTPGGNGINPVTGVTQGPGATTPGGDTGGGGNSVGDVPLFQNPPTTGEGAFLPSVNYQAVTGRALGSSLDDSENIDLSDPVLANFVLSQRPSGFEDEEIFFDDTPRKSVLVPNTTRVTDIFSNIISDNLLYMLENQNSYGDWDSTRAGAITPELIYSNLNDEAKQILTEVLNYDRSRLNVRQIFGIVGSRVLDGTISNVTLGSLRKLARASRNEKPLSITRSKSDIVNETVALALIEKNYYPLEPSASTGRARETLKNKKTLSSDIDRYIDVTIAGQTKRYYVNDDDTFIERSSLALKDGEYFDVTVSGEVTRIYAKSEKDHAFFVPEKTRQIAIDILGGDVTRILTVSGDPQGIELDYSLSTPRQDIYFLSCVLSSIDSTPDTKNHRHLKTSTARYENVPLTEIDQINEYIKYKDNHQTFVLDDEDLILDYVERDNHLFLTQTDIIVDSPKENKTIPLLTRQIPWYILLYPTNDPERNPFNAKSQIVNITPSSTFVEGRVVRQLRTRTSITEKFRDTVNQFISVELVGRGARDVFDLPTNQARINKLNLDNLNIRSGYVDSNKKNIPASDFTPTRKKTGYRLVAEIVKELDNNYLLGLNGIGKSITEFDVLCRLTFPQFNTLSRLENFEAIKNAVFNGMINEVKVTPGTKNADAKLAVRKTQLVRRKSTAPAQDQFPEVKSTNFNRSIAPPTTAEDPKFTPFVPATPPTALP